MEKWKCIKGFEDYEISNWGKVRKGNKFLKLIKRFGPRPRRRPMCLDVIIRKKGFTIGVAISVHSLVAQEFLKPCPEIEKYTIDHKDRNPFNNNSSNLRWATSLQQARNRTNKGRRNLEVIKFTMKDINKMNSLCNTNTLKQIGDIFGVKGGVIHILLRYVHKTY